MIGPAADGTLAVAGAVVPGLATAQKLRYRNEVADPPSPAAPVYLAYGAECSATKA